MHQIQERPGHPALHCTPDVSGGDANREAGCAAMWKVDHSMGTTDTFFVQASVIRARGTPGQKGLSAAGMTGRKQEPAWWKQARRLWGTEQGP